MMEPQKNFELISLSDLANINPSRPNIYNVDDTDLVSFIPMPDVTESGRWINHKTSLFKEVKHGYTFFQESDILFAKITPCMENGKGCLASSLENGIGFGSTEFHILRAKKDSNSQFIFQWSIFQNLRLKAEAAMTGSAGQQRVPASFFSKYKIPKIQKEEQEKIAIALSTVDRAIEQTEAIIAKQQRIKTGLMQDLLTKGIDKHGNIRSEETHEFNDSPLGRIPVEWRIKRVKDLFNMQLGKMLSKKAIEGKSPFPYLGNKNVQWDYVDISDVLDMNFSLEERKKYNLSLHDILICEGGEIGRTALWRMEIEDCYFQKAIHRLRPISDNYLPTLFPRYMKYITIKGCLSDFISQTSIAHLTQEKLADVPIILAPLNEQKRIVEILDELDKLLQNRQNYCQKLQTQKNGLMQDLLTGKVRVTPLLEPVESQP